MTTDVSSLPNAIDELVRRFRDGYSLERTGGGHYRVRDPEGELVQYQGKNLTLTGTGRSNAVSRMETALRRSGVLRDEQRTRRRRPLTSEQEQRRRQRLREVTELRTRNRQAVADALYERIATPLRNVSELDAEGMPAELARVAYMLLQRSGAPLEGITPDRAGHSAIRVARRGWVEARFQRMWTLLAEELERAGDAVVERWYELVREARGLPEDTVVVRRKPAEGEWPFRVELLPLEALIVDHDYQRPVPWQFVRRLAATFDETQVGTIDVSERRGHVYAILDGQLRFEACRLIRKTSVWASVYAGLEKTDEARFFLKKNRDRKAIHPFYVFKARIAAADPDALEIDRIVSDVGYKLSVGAPKLERPDNISAMAAIEQAYERHRPDRRSRTLEPVLRTLRASTYQREQGQNAVLIRGLSLIFASFGDDELDQERLTDAIAQAGPTFIIGRARDLYVGATPSTKDLASRVARVMLTDYNGGLPRSKQLRMPSGKE